MTVCTIYGCAKPTRSGKSPVCNMHYFRIYRNGTPDIVTTEQRVRDSYSEDENGCWLWHGGVDANGYGKYGGDWAHRFVYRLHRGDFGDLDLDHLCRVPLCVNPDHLEPVTHSENMRRASPYELVGTCRNGHPKSDETIYIRPNGNRECRACRKLRDGRT